MIVCLSLNPCLDKALSLPHFSMDAPNRVSVERVDLGGKGVNVARVLGVLKQPCRLVGFDYTGAPVAQAMNTVGVEHALVALDAPLRVNLKLQEQETGRILEINEAGAPIGVEELRQIAARLHLPQGSWTALSGSLPPGAPPETYRDFCRLLHQQGCRVAVDCDGVALRYALDATPDLIKPNAQEFAALTGADPSNPASVQAVCQALHRQGVGMICLSLGSAGAVLSTGSGSWHCPAADVPVCSAMGAGDSMLAGLLIALSRGDTPQEALRYASAVAGAAVMQPGTQPCRPQDVERLLALQRESN